MSILNIIFLTSNMIFAKTSNLAVETKTTPSALSYQIPHLIRLVPSDIDSRYQKYTQKVIECQKKQGETAAEDDSDENKLNKTDCNLMVESELKNLCVYELNLMSEPKSDAKKIGTLKYFFCSEPHWIFTDDKNKISNFKPDINDEDWGYFGNHHTLLEKKDSWYLLPKEPFEQEVWVNFSTDWKTNPEVTSLAESSLQIDVDGVLYFIFDVKNKEVIFKKSSTDSYCGDLDDPTDEDGTVAKRKKKIRSAKDTLKFSIDKFLTKEKHWKIPAVQLRGC